MEGFFSKKTPENVKKEKSEDGVDDKRRSLLRAALLAAGVATLPVVLQKDTHENVTIQEVEEPPTPEEVNHFKEAKKRVNAHAEKMRSLPYMQKPLKARAMVEQVATNPDLRSVVLAVEEDGEMITFHIPDVGEFRKAVNADRGKGSYVHTTGEAKYRITLADSHVDIGVSNRFSVERHTRGGDLQKQLSSFAVHRARYEKKYEEVEVVERGKKKKIRKDVGMYREYVTYVPPAEHLVTEEIIASGKEYIDAVLNAAYKTLLERMHHVENRKHILPICRDICKRLAIVEHVDPSILARAERKENGETETRVDIRRRAVFQKMYAEYGLNQKHAFNHLINPLGAGGMMQIMRRTYRDIRTRLIERNIFTQTEIPEDPDEGRKDPLISALISMYLCYDNYLPRATFFKGRRDDEIEFSLVVMYNGSPNLYEKILNSDEKKEEPKKGAKKKAPDTGSVSPIPYDNATPFILKILNHDKGAKLPGSGEAENRNYIRKYLLMKRLQKEGLV